MAFKFFGLDFLFGMVVEVLVDWVRCIICLEKIDSQIWLEIIGLVYCYGLFIISIFMVGYVEILEEIIIYFDCLC